MIGKIQTVAFQGLKVLPIDVQVHLCQGLPNFIIVGLADKAVAESRERIRAALSALGLSLPPKRIVVNLAPADILKEGSHYDLPIAMAILSALEILPADKMTQYLSLGELSLDGRLASVSGILSAAMDAVEKGLGLICPQTCGTEARWASRDLEILAAPSLIHLVNHFKGHQLIPPVFTPPFAAPKQFPDLAEIKGQETAKRVLEIAAAGGHNLLMIGPPGAGKSMLAARLPGILPPLTAPEALEVTLVHSAAGCLTHNTLVQHRPFRAPHHSASLAALVGGGSTARPGEISLAHRGVLFLDELPEYSRTALEALRQPLEDGEITISRAEVKMTYPAQIQLIAAMNPCRCGYAGDSQRECNKIPHCVKSYQSKISGPLLDRFDLWLMIPKVQPQDLLNPTIGEPSAVVASRVQQARKRQLERFLSLKADKRICTNSEAKGQLLYDTTILNDETKQLLHQTIEKFSLSARGYHRLLKVARTIADLDEQPLIHSAHLNEALVYRDLSILN